MENMNETEIKVKLDMLADLRAAVDVIALEKQALIDTILTPEIKAKLAEIDTEFAGKAEEATGKADALEAEIRAAVVQHGATVKGAFLQAVWNEPRVSWDTKGLVGFLVAHPEISAFRKEGEPSCTLRKV